MGYYTGVYLTIAIKLPHLQKIGRGINLKG